MRSTYPIASARMADKELLREVALELWGSVKKLRPGLPRSHAWN